MWRVSSEVIMKDRGGRRSELDRRRRFTPWYIPERRSGLERRSDFDRRIRKEDFTNIMFSLVPKRKTDGYVEALKSRRMFLFGPVFGLLTWAIIISITRILNGYFIPHQILLTGF